MLISDLIQVYLYIYLYIYIGIFIRLTNWSLALLWTQVLFLVKSFKSTDQAKIILL